MRTDENARPAAPSPPPFRVGDWIAPRWERGPLVVVEGMYRPLTGGMIPPGWWAVVREVESGDLRLWRISAATHEAVTP